MPQSPNSALVQLPICDVDMLNFTMDRVEEILKMAQFIAVFYAPKFLTSEKPDIAPIQVWSVEKTFVVEKILFFSTQSLG